ncbi:MAG: type II secretion system GspH family protein [Candidatus Omnitrophica bacterium]|nr:type II secretion system GspH family protein [Candidatus Omnitrophota bacterium]
MSKEASGFTLIELVLVIAILGLLVVSALPNIFNISLTQARINAEEGVVSAVRSGISLYYVSSCIDGACDGYPAELDNSAAGNCTRTNPCFDDVIKSGITTGGWSKIDDTNYQGPTGSQYEYDDSAGTFTYTED